MLARSSARTTITNSFILLGAVIPYSVLSLFLARHGFDIALLLRHITGTPGAAFFTADVVISALFVIYLAATNATLDRKRYWVIAAALLVGPSCAYPLYVRLNVK